MARFAEDVRPMAYGVHAFLPMASQGCGERVIHAVADDTAIEYVLIDSTVMRTHQAFVQRSKKRSASAWKLASWTEQQVAPCRR